MENECECTVLNLKKYTILTKDLNWMSLNTELNHTLLSHVRSYYILNIYLIFKFLNNLKNYILHFIQDAIYPIDSIVKTRPSLIIFILNHLKFFILFYNSVFLFKEK